MSRKLVAFMIQVTIVGLMTAGTAVCADEAKRLFYAPYDGMAEPKVSANDTVPRLAGDALFAVGVREEALVASAANRVTYDAKGNFNAAAGTLRCWVAPRNWVASTGNFAFFASLVGDTGSDLLLYKFSDSTKLLALLRNAAIGKSSAVEFDIAAWRSGEWHELALTWDAERLRLFVDGQEAGSAPVIAWPELRSLVVGSPYPGWAKQGDEESLIDELEILDRPLSPERIAADFQAAQARFGATKAADPAALAADVALYAGFDGGFEPRPASVRGRSRFENFNYAPGVRDRAVLLAGPEKRSIFYDGANLFDAAGGTVMVWVRPEWHPAAEECYFFASLVGARGRLLIYKAANTAQITLLMQDNSQSKPTILHAPLPNRAPGEWIFLGATFDADTVKLYLNGATAAAGRSQPVPYEHLFLGTVYPEWGKVGTEYTLFDDLYYYRRALEAPDIRSFYQPAEPTAAADVAPTDLARLDCGGMLIASSFGDYQSGYADNLIDGDAATAWKPFPGTEPPYDLELCWEHPRTIDRLGWVTPGANAIAAAEIAAYNAAADRYDTVKTLSSEELKAGRCQFPAVTAAKLRLRITALHPGVALRLCELNAFGPDQPLPGRNEPYWDAFYIWHQEPNNQYASNVPRYYRHEFTVTGPNWASAVIQARSNDFYRVWLNGVEVSQGATEIRPADVTTLLKEGVSVLAAESQLLYNPGQWGWGELLVELSINYPGTSRKIGTGAEWVSSTTAPQGWLNAGFDASDWKPVYCYTRPPHGPWGKIAYHSSAVRGEARLLGSNMPAAEVTAGRMLELEFSLQSAVNLAERYYFVAEAGHDAVTARYGDYRFSNAVGRATAAGGDRYTVKLELALPPWSPSGEQPLVLRGFDYENGEQLEIKGSLPLLRLASRSARFPKPNGVAKVAYINGQASFVIDGEAMAPLMWRQVFRGEPERIWRMGENSPIRIYNYMLYGGLIDTDASATAQAFANLDRQLTTALAVNPDALFVILPDLRPSTRWLNAHPDARLVTAFGKKDVVSFGSAEYDAACREFLRYLIAELKNKPYWQRIVGFQPWTCGVPDSGMGGVGENVWQRDRSRITVGDYNPGAIAKFQNFLRDRYANDVGALRRAWRDKTVTFESARPEIAKLTAEGVNGGVFHDPATAGAMLTDYADFLPRLLGDFERGLCALIKAETNREKMVFVHYGFVVEHQRGYNTPGAFLQNNNFDLPLWLADDNIDGYIGAPSYGHRYAGLPHLTYFPWSSFALHGRLYLPDDDTRYFHSGTRNYGHHRSLAESVGVVRRNIGADIARNIGSWFADMSGGSGRDGVSWTGRAEIASEIGRMAEVYNQARKAGYGSAAEIAVIFNPASMKHLDIYYGPVLANNLVNWTYYSEIFKLGAPFDVYMQSDLANPKIRRDYKLYIMMNAFSFTAAEKQAVEALKKQGGATFLWFYAPGYVDAERGLQTDGIATASGIAVRVLPGREQMQAVRTATEHPLTAALAADYRFETLGFSGASAQMHPTEFGPRFRIDDPEATVLARFADGGGAVAAREFAGWKSVYSVIPRLQVDFLRGVARWAGVHIYTEDEVVLDANAHFITLNNGDTMARTVRLRLPARRRVEDALTGAVLAKSAVELEIPMAQLESKVLRLR